MHLNNQTTVNVQKKSSLIWSVADLIRDFYKAHEYVIVNKLLAWMGAIGYSDYEGVTSPNYDGYRARRGVNVVRNYYNEYFRNTCFYGDCYKYGHGIMLMCWRTYSEEFLRIIVPNPPLAEQQGKRK